LPPHQITKPKFVEPLKDGGVLLSFLKPTLKAEQSEFKALKEMILYTPALDTLTKTPLYPLAKQLLQDFSHVFQKDIPHGYPQREPYNTTLTLFPKPSYPISLLIE